MEQIFIYLKSDCAQSVIRYSNAQVIEAHIYRHQRQGAPTLTSVTIRVASAYNSKTTINNGLLKNLLTSILCRKLAKVLTFKKCSTGIKAVPDWYSTLRKKFLRTSIL